MYGEMFLRGLIFGIAIAAPVGPIGVLCMRRTLVYGRVYGLVSGLGAATADALYGLIAGLGLAFMSTFMLNLGVWPQIVGGCFLLYLGITTALAHPAEQAAQSGGRMVAAYLSTLGLTLTNPMTILSFTALFASLGTVGAGSSAAKVLLLVVGVFIGSACWWLLLTSAVSAFRRRIGQTLLLWINRISGAIIALFGLVALVSAA